MCIRDRLIRELEEFKINVDAVDPFADPAEFQHEYGIELLKKVKKKYDAVVLAVNHQEYLGKESDYFNSFIKKGGLLYDVKGAFPGLMEEFRYLSL